MGFFVWSGTGTTVAEIPQPEQLPSGPTYSVSMTAYNALPEQTDSDPFTTASGAYSNPEVVVARSVDLAKDLPFGTIIEISAPEKKSNGCGYEFAADQIGLRVVADSMHPRKRNQVDVLLDHERIVNTGTRSLNPAVAMGFCEGVSIRVVGFVPIREIPKTQIELRELVRGAALTSNK